MDDFQSLWTTVINIFSTLVFSKALGVLGNSQDYIFLSSIDFVFSLSTKIKKKGMAALFFHFQISNFKH